MIGSAALSHVLQTLLYETEPLDPLVFGATPVALLLVVTVAAYIPARRASAVDPIVSMKVD